MKLPSMSQENSSESNRRMAVTEDDCHSLNERMVLNSSIKRACFATNHLVRSKILFKMLSFEALALNLCFNFIEKLHYLIARYILEDHLCLKLVSSPLYYFMR